MFASPALTAQEKPTPTQLNIPNIIITTQILMHTFK
jgi:hypothetical protein